MATSPSKPQKPTDAAPKNVDVPAAAAVKETAPAVDVDSKPEPKSHAKAEEKKAEARAEAKAAKEPTYRDAAAEYAAAILDLTESVASAVEYVGTKRAALHDLAPTYEDSRLHMHAARLDSALKDLIAANCGVRAMGADLAAS